MSNTKDAFRDVRDDAKERLAGDLNDLKSNFNQLKSDVGKIVTNAIGAGKASAQGGVDTARSQANAAVDRARNEYEHLKSRGVDQIDQLGELIGQKPVASALIAFGVGFVLAKILIRK